LARGEIPQAQTATARMISRQGANKKNPRSNDHRLIAKAGSGGLMISRQDAKIIPKR
jgi:hypothetical protein